MYTYNNMEHHSFRKQPQYVNIIACDASSDIHSAVVNNKDGQSGVCEGVGQLTGGHSAGFWFSFRKTSATPLCGFHCDHSEKQCVALAAARRNYSYCPSARQHNELVR